MNGVNIPLAAYLYETGQRRYRPARPAVPRLWREPVTDKWAREAASPTPRGQGDPTRRMRCLFSRRRSDAVAQADRAAASAAN